MIEIRGQHGEFVGVFDGTAERRNLDLRLPVQTETSTVFRSQDEPLTMASVEVVSLEWAQWWDTKRTSWILKATPSTEAKLDRVSRVFVRGQTSLTWLDREIKYRETLRRLVYWMILYRLPTTGVKH